LLDFDERPVGDDLPGVDDAPFLLQPVAGVGHPTLAEALGDPRVPFLEHALHLFGRQGAVGLAAVAVDEQEGSHLRAPFVREAWRRAALRGPPFSGMTNEVAGRGQESEILFRLYPEGPVLRGAIRGGGCGVVTPGQFACGTNVMRRAGEVSRPVAFSRSRALAWSVTAGCRAE